MAEDNVVLARARLAQSLKVVSADALVAVHEILKPGACDMATIGTALDSIEQVIAVARVQMQDYEQALEVQAIVASNNANRLLADFLGDAPVSEKEIIRFSQEIADQICVKLSNGISLNDICKEEGMPSKMSVWRWQRTNPDFAEQLQEARANMAEFLAGEIVKIADEEEDPNKAKVRINARQWVCAKLLPQRFGDKLDVSGTVSVGRVYSDEERAQAMLLILREGNINLPALIESAGE